MRVKRTVHIHNAVFFFLFQYKPSCSSVLVSLRIVFFLASNCKVIKLISCVFFASISTALSKIRERRTKQENVSSLYIESRYLLTLYWMDGSRRHYQRPGWYRGEIWLNRHPRKDSSYFISPEMLALSFQFTEEGKALGWSQNKKTLKFDNLFPSIRHFRHSLKQNDDSYRVFPPE